MKEHICVRVEKIAEYICQTKATVRDAAKIFGISKSTVHKDVTERLKTVNFNLYYETQKILEYNLSERHIRGGIATKEKYQKIHDGF